MSDILDSLSVCRAPVLGKLSHDDSYKFYYGDFIEINKNRYAIDGVGILNGSLVTEKNDLINANKKIDLFSLRGAISVYEEVLIDKVPYLKINPDPIGSCLIYSYNKKGVVAFSSDLESMVFWLKSQGVDVKKSNFYQAMVLAIGDGAFGYTSYEDISALESSKYVVAYQNRHQILDYGVEEYLKSEGSYECLLNAAEKDIKDNIKAISESRLDKIAHLTGGMDSRLVVSAISSMGDLGKYSIFCSGQHGYPDFDTAYALCSVLGAKMTNKQSLIQKNIPKDFQQYYKWSSLDNNGMLSNQPTNIGMTGNKNTLVVSGGYGECLRGYNLHCKDASLDYVINNLWPLCNSENTVRVPVQKEVVDEVKSSLGAYLISKLENGWSINDALQLIYLQEKNRYFVGNISKSYSRYTPRVDPLYSLPAFKAAYSLGVEDRADRVLMYDLMCRFDARLASFEFGTTAWPDTLYKKRGLVERKLTKSRDVTFESYKNTSNIDWLSKVSEQSKKEAISLGAPAWQVHNYQDIQKLSKIIISKHPEFFNSFDKIRVMRLLSNRLENRQNIRKVFQIYYALVWLYT